jgi:hypothetical protein
VLVSVWSCGGESAEMVRIASEAAVHDDKQRANAQCTAAERWLLHTALVPRLGQVPKQRRVRVRFYSNGWWAR